MFPVIQYNFSRDIYDYTFKEIMPQLIYGCGKIIYYRQANGTNNSKYRIVCHIYARRGFSFPIQKTPKHFASKE
jgi:hypothetical protein